MEALFQGINRIVWGVPALVLIMGVGAYLTVRTGFVQFRLLPAALSRFRRILLGKDKGGKSSFQALCTALGATVGTGNLVGVAGAICLGGPGSIFWMWVCGLLGMATKYAEVVLAMRYRIREGGAWLGGPMYVMERGLGPGWKPMAACYCFFGTVAAFGVGNATQINALVSAVNALGIGGDRLGNLILGAALAVLVGLLLSGGAARIGKAAEKLVPIAAGGYILICLVILLLRRQYLADAFRQILLGAFSPGAVTGGVLGSAACALRVGCARGVFTNEAGMGTASIAHAGADTREPAEQGMMGILEVFLDTIVICTLTALVILISGTEIPYGRDAGGLLTAAAFSRVLGAWTGYFLAGAIGCFAIATVLGWGLYGLRCARYLLGPGSENVFLAFQAAAVILGAVLNTGLIWSLAETMNGLMALPNLLALVILTREVVQLTPGKRKEV